MYQFDTPYIFFFILWTVIPLISFAFVKKQEWGFTPNWSTNERILDHTNIYASFKYVHKFLTTPADINLLCLFFCSFVESNCEL